MAASKFKFMTFTAKQKALLTWWCSDKYKHKDAIIADGAIRSGKTSILALSYVLWAMSNYDGNNFGMCGKTIGSYKRNVWSLLKTMLTLRGYKVSKTSDVGENVYIISKGKVQNFFYMFGGKDERSQDLVQGFTAAGFFFDEVALMPESFVNQAVARCSVEGSKLWFTCNPEGPFHWFKIEWIDKLSEKNAIRIHFELDDNPSLSESVKAKYRKRFSGVFFQRFILGLWVLAEGVIYSMFDQRMIVKRVPVGVKILNKWIGVDYGQANATVFILAGIGSDNKLYVLDEYYHSGRTDLQQKSPATYSKEYHKWKLKNGYSETNEDGDKIQFPVKIESTFIDPSAKGFMLQLHEDGEKRIKQANNDVLMGIELVSSIIDNDMFRILAHCKHTIGELGSYRWDPKAQAKGIDQPIKEDDHCMDGLRYIVNGTRLIWQKLITMNARVA